MNRKERFVFLDSNSLIHRAYHAYPAELTSPKGAQINVVYGFSLLLLKIIEDLKPEYIVAVFDLPAPTLRKKKYKDYKKNRKVPDRELLEQIPVVKEVVKAFDIPILEVAGYEADDVIGTIEDYDEIRDIEKIIVTVDQDIFQLIDSDTKIYMSGRNFKESKLFEAKDVEAKLGITPKQVIDWKALYGDPSDNIPGVPGIGKVGATKLIQQFKSLENIYNNLDQIENRYKTKLERGKDLALLSQDLATIMRDAPIDFDLKKCKWGTYNTREVLELFREFGFRSLVNTVQDLSSDKGVEEGDLEEIIPSTKAKVVNMTGAKELDKLINQIKEARKLVIDTHTYSDDIFETPVGVAVSLDEKTVYYIKVSLLYEGKKLTSCGRALKSLLEDKKILKISYDLKRSMHVLENIGIFIESGLFDIQIAAYLLQGGRGGMQLKDIAYSYVGEVVDSEDNGGQQMLTLEWGGHVSIIYRIYKILNQNLNKFSDPKSNWDLQKLFTNLEILLVHVLQKMERKGIVLDKKYLISFADKLDKQIKDEQVAAFKVVGHEFNIGSPKQVGEVLFEELSLPVISKTGKGSVSTSSSVLEKLKGTHPVIEHILNFREFSKLRSTYTTTLIDLVNKKTGRIHSSFNQTVTATGRLSSSNPNMQNIPISTELGREVRGAFISEKGYSFVSFDYAQQELRILAHMAEEHSLIDAFKKEVDVHSLTAAKIFKKDIKNISKQERTVGKTINFGIMYGMSSHGLAASLNVSRTEAQGFIDKYFQQYSSIKNFFDGYLDEVKQRGYAETIFGRRKLISKSGGKISSFSGGMVRELINFPIQGSAADIMKMAMLKADELIQKKYSDKAAMILQIHDELVFEYKGTDKLSTFKSEMQDVMESAVKLSVPVRVDIDEGKSLKEIH